MSPNATSTTRRFAILGARGARPRRARVGQCLARSLAPTVAPLVALLGGAPPSPAQSADAALARAQQAYNATHTFTAGFVQTIDNPMLGAPEESSGLIYLAPPSKFAMRFSQPAGDRIVADGHWLWIYAKSSVADQVIKQPIPTAGSLTPNLVGQFVDRPRERYDAEFLGVDTVRQNTVDVVRLTPKAPHPPFRQADIAVDRDNGLLRRVALIEASGQKRTITFEFIRANHPIPPDIFTFHVPKGVKVVTP